MPRSDIWVGDLVKGLRALAPSTDASADAIAELLGLTDSFRAQEAARLLDFAQSRTQVTDNARIEAIAAAATSVIQNVRVEPSPQPANAAQGIERVLAPVATEPPPAATRWDSVEALPRPDAGAPATEPAHDPLLDARWHRDIAVAAAAQLLPLGPPDVVTLVGRAARGLPIVSVPRKRRWSITRGVQLLIDGGSGMDPFRKDQSAFATVLKSVVGPERVEVVEFADAPLRGIVDAATGGLRAYRPPAPGVPIVVLSDLGHGPRARDGARATASEWQGFSAAVARHAPRTITFAPYPPSLLPARLRRDLGAVYWDRSTSHRQLREVSRNAGDSSAGTSRSRRDATARSVAARGVARDLAVLVAPAVFIEPELLRAMRLALLPSAGPEIEAAVWFSAAVRVRNPSGLVFHADVAAGLRDTLQAGWRTTPALRAQLTAARDVMDRIHQRQSAALRLEERLAWCVVTDDVGGAERELERALKAHVEGTRPGIAAWAGPAWKRMPAQARETRSGWLFHQLARTTAQGRDLLPTDPPPDLRPEDLSAAIGMVQDVKFGVRRVDATLELGNFAGEGAVAIMLPDLEPRIVDVVTTAGQHRVEVRARDRAVVDVGNGQVTLKTLRGSVYELAAASPAASRHEDRPVPPPPRSTEPRRSWGQTWPAWEIRFDAEGGLVNPPVLTAPAAESLTDLFVLVHGWNAGPEQARSIYSRLLQQPGLALPRGMAANRRFGAMGVIWPSELWSDTEDDSIDAGVDAPDSLSELSQSPGVEGSDAGERGEDTVRGGLFGAIWNSAKSAARMTTFYQMRTRAATVGRRGLGPALGQIARISPGLRVHVIAHSIGARLASYAVQEGQAGSPDVRLVKSLVLLQPIIARHAFAHALPSNPGHGGALASVPKAVDGPIVVTYAATDTAARVAYEMAIRVTGGDEDAPGERVGKAMGYDGAHGVDALKLRLGPVGTVYPLEPNHVTNVDASAFVKAHADVTVPEIGWLMLAAAGAAADPASMPS